METKVEPYPQGFTLAPGQSRDLTLEIPNGPELAALKASFWRGDKFSYLDIFGHAHTVSYCFYFSPRGNGSFQPCPMTYQNE
jgi:hypothetical protein